MKASLLVPSDDGQGVSREPLSVVVIHQNSQAKEQAELFYRMMEQEFGDDFCFDCVYWAVESLEQEPRTVTQDASEADLVLVATGQGSGRGDFFVQLANWLRDVRATRHAPFSLICLTDDPLLASDRVHADFQQVAGHFSMIYLQEGDQAGPRNRTGSLVSAVAISPVILTRLVRTDPHPTGGIND